MLKASTILDFVAPWGTIDGDYRALTGRGQRWAWWAMLAGLLLPIRSFFARGPRAA